MKPLYKLSLLFLFFTQCFDLVYMHLPYGVMTFFLLITACLGFTKKRLFAKPIIVYVVGIVCACISSSYFRGQTGILTTFNQSYYYVSLLFFFVCAYVKPSIHDVEKMLVYAGFFACFLYLVQYLIYPFPILLDAAQHVYVGDVRVRMCGSLIFIFLIMYYLNRYIATKSQKNLLFALPPLLCEFILGFRSLTLAILGCGFLLILFSSGKASRKIKIIAPLVVLLVVISQVGVVHEKIDSMIARQQAGHNFNNKDYARVLELEYYTKNYFNNSIEQFWGSGPPIYGTKFYVRETEFMERMGLFWSDWGILGLSWIFGIPTALALAYLLVRVMLIKLPKEYIYIKAVFGVLLLTALSLAETYRNGNLIVLGILLYMVSLICEQYKR